MSAETATIDPEVLRHDRTMERFAESTEKLIYIDEILDAQDEVGFRAYEYAAEHSVDPDSDEAVEASIASVMAEAEETFMTTYIAGKPGSVKYADEIAEMLHGDPEDDDSIGVFGEMKARILMDADELKTVYDDDTRHEMIEQHTDRKEAAMLEAREATGHYITSRPAAVTAFERSAQRIVDGEEITAVTADEISTLKEALAAEDMAEITSPDGGELSELGGRYAKVMIKNTIENNTDFSEPLWDAVATHMEGRGLHAKEIVEQKVEMDQIAKDVEASRNYVAELQAKSGKRLFRKLENDKDYQAAWNIYKNNLTRMALAVRNSGEVGRVDEEEKGMLEFLIIQESVKEAEEMTNAVKAEREKIEAGRGKIGKAITSAAEWMAGNKKKTMVAGAVGTGLFVAASAGVSVPVAAAVVLGRRVGGSAVISGFKRVADRMSTGAAELDGRIAKLGHAENDEARFEALQAYTETIILQERKQRRRNAAFGGATIIGGMAVGAGINGTIDGLMTGMRPTDWTPDGIANTAGDLRIPFTDIGGAESYDGFGDAVGEAAGTVLAESAVDIEPVYEFVPSDGEVINPNNFEYYLNQDALEIEPQGDISAELGKPEGYIEATEEGYKVIAMSGSETDSIWRASESMLEAWTGETPTDAQINELKNYLIDERGYGHGPNDWLYVDDVVEVSNQEMTELFGPAEAEAVSTEVVNAADSTNGVADFQAEEAQVEVGTETEVEPAQTETEIETETETETSPEAEPAAETADTEGEGGHDDTPTHEAGPAFESTEEFRTALDNYIDTAEGREAWMNLLVSQSEFVQVQDMSSELIREQARSLFENPSPSFGIYQFGARTALTEQAFANGWSVEQAFSQGLPETAAQDIRAAIAESLGDNSDYGLAA